MVNIRANDRQKGPGSPKLEVGEIDTRAPFQSVKAAVSLFGEVAISRQRSTPRRSKLSSENVLDKETQLMLAQKEMGKIKQKLETAENTKARALAELERAKRTVADLSTKLQTVNKSKQSAIQAKESVKQQAEQLELEKSSAPGRKHELDNAREQYLTATAELVSTKQQLNKIRQDFDVALETKLAAFQQAAEAQRTANLNSERVTELSKEIAAMKEAIRQVKFATAQAQQEQTKIAEEKDACQQFYKTAKEEAKEKLQSLKEDYDPELTRNLEAKLKQTTVEIENLQEEMKKAHASEMDVVRVVTKDLNEATRTLQQVADEECSLRSLVNSLRMELEDVNREQIKLKEKEAEKALMEEEKQLDALNEEDLKLEQLSSETASLRREAEEIRKNAEALKQEAEAARIAAKEAEKKLELALRELEEAKAAEKRTLDEMKILPERKETDTHESSSKIRISAQEYESLSRKVEESGKLADREVAAAAAKLEEINASKCSVDKKMEANLIAIEEIKAATDMALKSAEMAEAAHNAVESELRKWRQEVPEA